MNAIEVKALTKIYKKSGMHREALSSIDLSIPEGSFFGLLGPNGAGKSTFINILAGLVIKTSGKINISGFDFDNENIKARYSLGVVPQELVLDPFFTVRQTIQNYCNFYGVENGKTRTHEIISALGLEDKADIHPRKLSGGMQRRLLVAKALVHSPKILILDEPTAGVDIELRKQLWSYVKNLNRQGTTIILTTHYLEEAQELCNQIAIINKGKIIANDKTQNLINLLDHKEINIKFSEVLHFVPPAFQILNASIVSDGSMNIKYKPKEVSINKIIELIKTTHLEIKDISTKDADLEDVFSYLVS